jgi:sucrose-phosphate synthase
VGEDHVRSAVPRLGKADGAQEADLAVDAAACSVHCHAYVAKDTSKLSRAPPLPRTPFDDNTS